jgi:anti-sigma-K factor RskA
MSAFDDIDALAAEYVLGTLDAAERELVARRRQVEPMLDRAIENWQVRLSPLTEALAPIEPPAEIFGAIERRIDTVTAEEAQGKVVDLTRRLRRWRLAAVGSGALAACLAIGFGLRETVMRTEPRSFVAVLQKDAASPAFIVTVDIDTKSLTVRPVDAPARPGKSYELWIIDASLGAPKSLGVVGDQKFTQRAALARFDRTVVEKATYAVTLEPAGGSPTGAATGPVLWTGHLVQATP